MYSVIRVPSVPGILKRDQLAFAKLFIIRFSASTVRSCHDGPARELEGLPSAFSRFLSNRSLSGIVAERKASFNRINRKTGNRLKQQNIDSETGEVVPREDTARGYEVGKGRYFLVENEEFEAVQIESTRTIDIDQFVPKSEIDERYIERALRR